MLCAALLLGTMGTAQTPGAGEMGPVYVADSPSEPVDPLAPSEWDDPVPWGGNPPPWFEDPSTVQCQSDACWQALENKTGA